MKQTTPADAKTGIPRLLELAAMKQPLVIASVVLSAVAAVAAFIPHVTIYYIVMELLKAYPDFSALDLARVSSLGWLAFGGILANIVLYFAALMFSHYAAFGTLYELKVNFASHLARLPLGFHVVTGSGKLRKIMDENIEKIEGFIAHQLPDIVASFVAPVVMLCILLAVDWRMGLASITGIALALIIQMRGYGNGSAKSYMDQYQNALEDMNNASVEYIRGITVVKAFGQTVYSLRRMHEAIQRYTKMVIPYTLSWENIMSSFTTVVNNIYLFLIPVGILIGTHTADYTTHAGKFIFYLIFVPSIATVLTKLMYVSSSGLQISGGVERMDAILAEPELPQPKAPQQVQGYDIQFDHVSFAYRDQQNEALSDVCFRAKQGTVTAIVGPSGGGKSTIAHLLPRFFDVASGNIRIGAVDVRDMSTAHLMQNVSFVFQDVFLFKQSIMDNIRIGNRDATDEQIIAAAKAAQCHGFIEALPNKYQTVIGTRGIHLSGGERQRIAIARAIVKDAPIIVLDEATAFSDPENEYLIQQAFERLMQGKTVIMIAHRLSTIRSADNILVMDQGRLVEQGNHEALMARHGKYHAMWGMYTQALSWKMDRKEAQANG